MGTKLRNTIIAFGVPTVYAIILRIFFGVNTWDNLFSVMSLTFLFLLPTIVGVLTVYLLDEEKVKKVSYRVLAPWLPISLFLLITLALSIEGWACWIMALPLFLVTSSIGGLIGGHLKLKKIKNRLNTLIIFLLPLFISPLESMIESVPGIYEAYTFIDIDASAEKIWSNVTRVREITEKEDKGFLSAFLGFPRPVRAELDFEGEGAFREAIFTNGLTFNETVTEYKDQEKMVFTIKANTQDIPSATLDKHILIGGDYFDVLNGTYELERIGTQKYRLHLYSHFKMNTTFNFYAGWWGKWIMKDIQNNILRIEKARAEKE